jgi:hypothetical protein
MTPMSDSSDAGPYFTDETPTFSGSGGAAVIRVTRSPTDSTPIGIAYGTWSDTSSQFIYILYVNGIRLSGSWIVEHGRFGRSVD